MDARAERTFVMVKPDGVQRGLVGEIMRRFENRGFKLVALKMCSPSREHLETHYGDLKSKKFFPDLISYMLMGPVVAMVWEGLTATSTGRRLVGETNPQNSLPGTIRGDFCLETGRNIIHASDSVESAEKEIKLWFQESEVNTWQLATKSWVYEI
jgi:nucleoside-diphosphate kinase